jgi:hypothetical protein
VWCLGRISAFDNVAKAQKEIGGCLAIQGQLFVYEQWLTRF